MTWPTLELRDLRTLLWIQHSSPNCGPTLSTSQSKRECVLHVDAADAHGGARKGLSLGPSSSASKLSNQLRHPSTLCWRQWVSVDWGRGATLEGEVLFTWEHASLGQEVLPREFYESPILKQVQGSGKNTWHEDLCFQPGLSLTSVIPRRLVHLSWFQFPQTCTTHKTALLWESNEIICVKCFENDEALLLQFWSKTRLKWKAHTIELCKLEIISYF